MDTRPISAGDLCSIPDSDAGYRVVKVLMVEEGVVHVRLYANRFAERPVDVDVGTLELGTIHDDSFGIGHMPLDPAAFAAWRPQVIAHAPVEADELEGYEQWREAAESGEAGVFGAERRFSLGPRLRRLFGRG